MLIMSKRFQIEIWTMITTNIRWIFKLNYPGTWLFDKYFRRVYKQHSTFPWWRSVEQLTLSVASYHFLKSVVVVCALVRFHLRWMFAFILQTYRIFLQKLHEIQSYRYCWMAENFFWKNYSCENRLSIFNHARLNTANIVLVWCRMRFKVSAKDWQRWRSN